MKATEARQILNKAKIYRKGGNALVPAGSGGIVERALTTLGYRFRVTFPSTHNALWSKETKP